MNKKKIMIIVSSIILVLAALFTTTYSLFYKEDVAANPSNYSTGILQIEATSLSDKPRSLSTNPLILHKDRKEVPRREVS